jgi:hypothetical protein
MLSAFLCIALLSQLSPFLPRIHTIRATRRIDYNQYKSFKLVDIEERMPAGHIYANRNDKTNWAHETVHGLNSRLRGQVGPGVSPFYIGNGRYWIVANPKTTLTRVSQQIDPKWRRHIYDLYFRQQLPSWNDTPLYVLDEWTAYLSGAEVSRELWGYDATNTPDDRYAPADILSAQLMYRYAEALVEAIKIDDPNYKDMENLTSFVNYNKQRTISLVKQRVPNKPYVPKREVITLATTAHRMFGHYDNNVKMPYWVLSYSWLNRTKYSVWMVTKRYPDGKINKKNVMLIADFGENKEEAFRYVEWKNGQWSMSNVQPEATK